MAEDNSISLNKYISSTGICSRREADKWIEDGKVTINRQIAQKGNRVLDGDEVHIDGQLLAATPKLVYLALNKPPGITCTTDLKDKTNIVEFINHKERIFPIGRLDKPSTGLILLTNDGDIVNKILRSEFNHEKEYIVSVNKKITPAFIASMSKKVPILGTYTKPCKVFSINDFTFKIILTEGMNRQIRRMCEVFDYQVVTLKRIRIMNIQLGNLPEGKWRDLTKEEFETLNKSLK